MPITFSVNGESRTVSAQRAEVRMRGCTVRGLHGACRRGADSLLSKADVDGFGP